MYNLDTYKDLWNNDAIRAVRSQNSSGYDD